VIDNVLDNAAKYSPRERPVEVGVSGETRQGEQCAVLSVRDYGIGIPAADLPHIFEQYHRGGNVGSTSGEGLGLASARQLIMLHGGSIEVDSKEGVGSVFTLILPLASGTSGKAD
jgi:signal transduction histidine kinase